MAICWGGGGGGGVVVGSVSASSSAQQGLHVRRKIYISIRILTSAGIVRRRVTPPRGRFRLSLIH